jgi:hypothetical protein
MNVIWQPEQQAATEENRNLAELRSRRTLRAMSSEYPQGANTEVKQEGTKTSRALHEFEHGDFVTVSMYEGRSKQPMYTFTGLLDMSPMDDKTATDINDWEARTLDVIAGEEDMSIPEGWDIDEMSGG